jgi:hypothetical protein
MPENMKHQVAAGAVRIAQGKERWDHNLHPPGIGKWHVLIRSIHPRLKRS